MDPAKGLKLEKVVVTEGLDHKTQVVATDKDGRQVTICYLEDMDINDPVIMDAAEQRFDIRSKTPVIGMWR